MLAPRPRPPPPAPRRHRPRASRRAPITAAAPPNLSTPPTDAARAASFPTAPVPELPDPAPLSVTGKLPPWLRGAFVRNGPGAWPAPLNHMFDGYALLARFDVDGAANAITQRQRFLDTKAWAAMKAGGGRMAFSEFGTAAGVGATLSSLLASVFSGGPAFGTDNASVTVRPGRDGELVASTETPAGRVRVRAADLTTIGVVPPTDGVRADLICAHTVPRSDGSLVGFGAGIGRGISVYLEDASTCGRTVVADLPLRRGGIAPCWMHAFPATDGAWKRGGGGRSS